MKRTLSLLLTFALLLTLAACGSTAGQAGTGSNPAPEGDAPTSTTPETPPTSQPEDTTSPEDETPEEADDGKKILIAYFSATNNTENIANLLNEILDADLYEIVPETPYTSDDLNYNDSSSRSSQEMNDPDARPAISGSVDNMEQYDVIFLGYPIWWGEAPRIINTFVESYDFSGKTIVPFCTSGGSGMGSSATNLQSSASGATWLSGRRLNSGVSQSEIAEWVNGLGLELPAE